MFVFGEAVKLEPEHEHFRLELDDSLLIASGVYLLLIAIYVVHVTLYPVG